MRTVLYGLLVFYMNLHTVSSQDNFITLKPERVYLHTDRNIYFAGDYLYYAMYLKVDPEQASRYAYLLIRDSANSVVAHVRLEINNRRSFGSIVLSDTLKTGYYQLVCFTNLMRNAEETLFKKEIVIANRFDDKLEKFLEQEAKSISDISDFVASGIADNDQNLIIHLDRKVFKPRDKILFYVESKDPKGDQPASLSVSVSEFVPGTPVEPAISDYFDKSLKGSREVNTSRVPCNFRPEFNSIVLQGRVIPAYSTGSGLTVPSYPERKYSIFLSTVDSIANLQYAATDSLGSFGFNLNPWYEGKEIIIRMKEQAGAALVLDGKTSLAQLFTPSQDYNVRGMRDYLLKSIKILQVQRYYNKRTVLDTTRLTDTYHEIPRVFYKHYQTILPSDYIELPDFIEIAKEIVPGLRVRKVNDTFVSGYPNLKYQSGTDDEATIFLDGVPIDDINQIITFGTGDIKRIETVPVIRYLGDMSFPGILAVVSNNMEINNIRFKTPSVRYQVLSSQSFTRPEPFMPGSILNRYPDLRHVLLWEPELIPESSGKQTVECYASDLEGTYRINIQGVSVNGEPLTGSAYFKIQSR